MNNRTSSGVIGSVESFLGIGGSLPLKNNFFVPKVLFLGFPVICIPI
ncbi:hypothetical protein ADIS_3852 [Lunatimonas lonarensis]|uniref:Uncharacterized protein n=1 Tax=Lunatimonas lonarensis TaxID=1232681 RepID=R7ZNP7_9BACT|nr:hypothetical protein ADIS_3852 [Lunatimonas lonarensis]